MTDLLETKNTDSSVFQNKKKVFKIFFGRSRRKGLQNFFQAISKKGKQKSFLQIFREVYAVFQQNFNKSNYNAVFDSSTGQFSRTWGFKAKAKDLTFEAKDFKMCPWRRPRGQKCPRGLQLIFIDAVNGFRFAGFSRSPCSTLSTTIGYYFDSNPILIVACWVRQFTNYSFAWQE